VCREYELLQIVFVCRLLDWKSGESNANLQEIERARRISASDWPRKKNRMLVRVYTIKIEFS